MRNKWNLKSTKQLFLDNQLILDEDKYLNCSTKMKCHDYDGYKYYLTLNEIQSRRTPYKFSVSNPFTLENINTFLRINGSKTIVISTEYNGNKEKIKFKCECGNIFESNINNMISNNKTYCNFCCRSKRYDKLKDYTQLVLNECARKNYKLITPYINRSTDCFEYICVKHLNKGLQKSNYNRMVNRGQGCMYCGIESRNISHRTKEDVFIKMANQKGFDYVGCDYPQQNSGYKKARLHLICKKHPNKGIQYFTYNNLCRNKVGCRYCAGYGRTSEELQNQIDELGLNISILQYNSYADLICKCNSCGYTWQNKGVNLTQGHGCPICKKSKGEIAIQMVLQKLGYSYCAQYVFNDCRDIAPLPFDFYLDKCNILIEYDGKQHYMPIDFNGDGYESALKNFQITRKHDNIKSEYCLKNNIPLIRIPYWDFESNKLEHSLCYYLKLYNTVN